MAESKDGDDEPETSRKEKGSGGKSKVMKASTSKSRKQVELNGLYLYLTFSLLQLFLYSAILEYLLSILLLGLASLNWNLIMILITLLCLPTVAAMPTQDHFPDVTFKVFSDFVIQKFSS